MYLDKKGPRKVSKQFPFSGQYSCGRDENGNAAPPQNFGQLRFFGQQEKIWAKPVFKDVSMFFYYSKETNIFYFKLKKS